jgi:glycosyltransferase involved in cell wall biosynthesis
MSTLVSVIIPTYNSARYLGEAIRSCLGQDYAPIEVIVVDDGSTDDTAHVAGMFGSRVRYMRQDNAGPSVARNWGIRESNGEYIAFLDADDWWNPSKLARQVACFDADGEVGLVHTDVIEFRETDKGYNPSKHDRGAIVGYCLDELFRANRVATSSVMIRRECLQSAGVFDESIRAAEDLDLWLRIAKRYQFAHVDAPLVTYRCHPANSSGNTEKMARGLYYVLQKAWQSDPHLRSLIGNTRGRCQLGSLAFHAGYWTLETGDSRRAREYFRAACAYGGLDPKSMSYWLSTYIPSGVRKSMRAVKRRLIEMMSSFAAR